MGYQGWWERELGIYSVKNGIYADDPGKEGGRLNRLVFMIIHIIMNIIE